MTAQTTKARTWKRTHTCGDLRLQHVDQEVILNGWVDARRNHGGIYFVDLRDRYGITQVVLREELAGATKIGPEFVISVRGKVLGRDAANVNPQRETGEIEVIVQDLEILSSSPTPPFEVLEELDTAIETRLRYRFIDLRRGPLQRNMIHRSRFVNAMRRAFERQNFIEVETPILTKATPEGARDYLVPSRVHPGEFYALPQSPQIFKQILMVSGFDRYFQVARCFRDEDLRADRQPEFTQLDMEMSFVEEEEVFAAWEKIMVETFAEVQGVQLETPFQRMPFAEAMERFGSDKPDLRFGLELCDVAEWARGSDFKVFTSVLESGGRVVGLCVPQAKDFSRKQVEALGAVVGEYGAKGLAWWKASREGGTGPLARFAAGEKAGALMDMMGAEDGDLCLFVADRESVVLRSLGELRIHLADQLDLREGAWKFLWVTEFPLFQRDEESGRLASAHHPFTAPVDWDMAGADSEPEKLASRAYDLVLNGWELGSGSVRIHRTDVQTKIFELLQIEPEEQELKFGFLLEALRYGPPPHAGFALGLDRTVALTLGLDNIRDVVAFPKTTSASDLMCGAPSEVSPQQLEEVHVRSVAKPASSS